MDLEFSERERQVSRTARDLLRRELPLELWVGHEPTNDDVRRVWGRLAAWGWLGATVPGVYGGTQGTLVEAVLLLEEMGRVLVPGPFLPAVVGVARTLGRCGTAAQRERYLPALAAGRLMLTLAVGERSGGHFPHLLGTTCFPQAGRMVVSGEKFLVPWACCADLIACLCRFPQGAGFALALLPVDAPGLSITPLETAAEMGCASLHLEEVPLSPEEVLPLGWEEVLDLLVEAGIGGAAYQVGAAQAALEMAVEYAKNRVQFGRPIGSFQAIQHLCADAFMNIEKARYLCYQAAWCRDDGAPARYEGGMAAFKAALTLGNTVALMHQTHGAIGFALEHPAQLFSRRAKLLDVIYGEADFWADLLVTALDEVAHEQA